MRTADNASALFAVCDFNEIDTIRRDQRQHFVVGTQSYFLNDVLAFVVAGIENGNNLFSALAVSAYPAFLNFAAEISSRRSLSKELRPVFGGATDDPSAFTHFAPIIFP